MTSSNFESMSNAEMVAEYNRIAKTIGSQSVLRFPDSKTGIRRLKKIAAAAAEHATTKATKAVAKAKDGTPKGAKLPEKREPKTTKGGRASSMAGKTLFAYSKENPRREGSHGWKSYNILAAKLDGVLYEDYIAAGGRGNDLRWDIDKGWVTLSKD